MFLCKCKKIKCNTKNICSAKLALYIFGITFLSTILSLFIISNFLEDLLILRYILLGYLLSFSFILIIVQVIYIIFECNVEDIDDDDENYIHKEISFKYYDPNKDDHYEPLSTTDYDSDSIF